jgi:hypothetical protein
MPNPSRLAVMAAVAVGLSLASARADVRVFAWSDVDRAFRDSMTPMVRAFPGANPAHVAAQLNAMPAGRRVLLILNFTEPLALHPDDRCVQVGADGRSTVTEFRGPWLEQGERAVRQSMDDFFGRLKAAGAAIDALVVDNETDTRAGRFLGSNGANLEAIQRDPRFPALAQRLGFGDLTVDGMWYGSERHRRWDEVVLAEFDAAHHRAVAEPFLSRWPSATVSNYGSAPIAREHAVPDMSGHATVRGGQGFGTHDSIDFYGLALQWLERSSFRGVRLDDTPYDMFRMNVHKLRSIDRSSDKPMQPWIGSWGLGARSERDDYPSPLSMSEYWRENVIQLAMHGCDTLLLFNPHAWRPEHDPTKFNVLGDQQRLHATVAELNTRLHGAGASRWASIPSLEEHVIATGRGVPGGTLWRFSFAPGVDRVAVARRDGSVIRVEREAGGAGAWVFESASAPFAMKGDGHEVAMALAQPGSSWPDLNGDGALDARDETVLTVFAGSANPSIDLDGSGSVGPSDVLLARAIRAEWGSHAVNSSLKGPLSGAALVGSGMAAVAGRFDAAPGSGVGARAPVAAVASAGVPAPAPAASRVAATSAAKPAVAAATPGTASRAAAPAAIKASAGRASAVASAQATKKKAVAAKAAPVTKRR